MIKLHKRREDGISYHEAWLTESVVFEHWGEVGQRGSVKQHGVQPGERETDALERILASARAAGFVEIDEDDLRVLSIEYETDDRRTAGDLEKRHALEARMNETLGWTGLGRCDGGSIGSETMEVRCLVVDAEIARGVIEFDLSNTEFSDYIRMYEESED